MNLREEPFFPNNKTKQNKSWTRKGSHWAKPRENWIKVDFDGSVNHSSSDIGFIIRDHTKKLLLSHRVTTNNPLHAEAFATLAGVKVVVCMGFCNIVVEGDNLVVINSLKKT
ncbi:LOW QUALITY PROTEIN: hypothetical protein V2J09_004490 [Rumex salicifolius]